MATLGSREGHPLCAGSLPAAIVVIAVLTAAGSALAAGPPAGVSTQEWPTIQAQIEAEHHKITESDRPGRLYRADNPAQRFTAHFGAEDVVIEPAGRGEPAWHLGLRLTAWGSADNLQPVSAAGAIADGDRVEYRRGPLTEWYVNTAMGLEQGFTVDAPPGDDIDELVLEMTIDGDLTPELSEHGRGISFHRPGSHATLAYSGLVAWDAVDERLDARIRLVDDGTKLRLAVAVSAAAWPITIDPIFSQVAKLLPTPNLDSSYASFGTSVAIDGDLLVAGLYDHERGYRSGAAHVFHRDQGGAGAWGHVAKITASDGAPRDEFGAAVAISGDTVVVGARNDGDNGENAGSVYVFQRDQGGSDAWGQVAKIAPADIDDFMAFGVAVAIHGDTIVVGAPGDDDNGQGSGAAYLFQRNQGGLDAWGQIAKMTAATGAAFDAFGSSVSISGDTAVVGAVPLVINADDIGFACVFQRDHGGPDTWGQVARLTAGDGFAGDHFGLTVAVGGDIAIVGAERARVNGYDRGAAYVYRRDQDGQDVWGQVIKITAADGVSGDRFGSAVAIGADTAIVGADRDGDNGLFSGSAYVYERDQGGVDAWGEVAKIVAADGGGGDHFGSSATVAGDTVLVGAPSQDAPFESSGSLYLFERDQGGPDNWGQTVKLPCPPVFAADEDYFGLVAISGDTVVAGASGDDENGFDSGAAYLFNRDQGAPNTWENVAKIAPADPGVEDHFGGSTAIADDTVIVGARSDDDNGSGSGSAYIFLRDQGGPDNWGQVAKLTPAQGAAQENFGHSVSISSDTAIVGTFGDDLGTNSGSAFIFRRGHGGPDNWGQVTKIVPTDGAEGDHFGISVSISGETAVVGACFDDDNGSNSGSAYVYQQDLGGVNGWGMAAKITPDDGQEGDRFGCAVSIDGDTVIVGAGEDDDNGDRSGSAYIFGRHHGGADAWGQVAKIVPTDGGLLHLFGESVAVSGDTAIVGAHNDIVNGSSTGWGSAYIFRRDHGGADVWGQVAKITPADGADNDHFGSSVAVDAHISVIGAIESDSLGLDSGAAYVFFISGAFFADGFETGDTSGWSATAP